MKYLYSCVSNERVFGGNEKLKFLVYTKCHFDISIIELYKLIGLDFSNCITEIRLKD